MQGKLRQLMKHEGINSTRLAEILGIQASGISHIMSGRNKPSFDFLLKLLQRFPQINPDWLLLDKGPMYRDEIKQKSGAGNSSGPRGAAGAGGFGASGVAAGAGGAVGTGGAESAESAAIFGDPGASGGLFGPDNDDIISAGGFAGNRPGGFPEDRPGGFPEDRPGGFPSGHSGVQTDLQDARTDRQGAPPNTQPNLQQRVQQKLQQLQQNQQQAGLHAGQQTGQQDQLQSHPQTAPQAAQSAIYQSGGFKKSASIERIVVFYKDKTFSEYQPE